MQTVTILWRYSGSPSASGEDFTDEADISAYANAAVDWSRANGVVSGNPDGSFNPQGHITRAQIAQVLYQYLKTDTSTGEDPQVFMTTDISPEGLMAVYNALGWTPTGEVAMKLSTGEPPASNYLRPELIKDVVQAVNGTIVECNTAYGGSRASTAMHYQVAKDHGFTDIADVVILDENGSMSLPVTGGSQLSENLVGAHFADYDSYLVLSHFKGHAMAGFGGFGGSGIHLAGEKEGARTIATAIEKGINYFDMAVSEAEAFPSYRAAFRGTKDRVYLQMHFGADYSRKLEAHAGDCVQCGRRCPFHVAQSDRMKEIAAYFGA